MGLGARFWRGNKLEQLARFAQAPEMFGGPATRGQIGRIVASIERRSGFEYRSAGRIGCGSFGERGQVENPHGGAGLTQARGEFRHSLPAGRVVIRPQPALAARQRANIRLADGVCTARKGANNVARKQQRGRVGGLLAFGDNHRRGRQFGEARQAVQGHKRAGRRPFPLPGQTPRRIAPQGKRGELLSLGGRIEAAMVHQHAAGRIAIGPHLRGLAVAQIAGRRLGRIEGHGRNPLGASHGSRGTLGRLYRSATA